MPQLQCGYPKSDFSRYGGEEFSGDNVIEECRRIISKISRDNESLQGTEACDIWNYILDIRQFILMYANDTIRILTRLCFKLDEREQIREITGLLFKFNYLLEHNFYNFSDNYSQGIPRFMNLLKSTYGNDRRFIREFDKVKTMIEFTRSGQDRELIREYKYLKNISLPVRGYENLRINLFTIMKKFNQLLPIVSERAVYKKFRYEIYQYRRLYIKEYQKQHLYYQNKFKYFRRKLSTMAEYKVLEKLTAIDYLGHNHRNITPKEYIDGFFAGECNEEDIQSILREKPRCSCGFVIGQMATIPDINKILPVLKKHIKRYLAILQQDKYVIERLKKYTVDNPLSPVTRIIPLPSFSGLSVTYLNNILTPDMITEINNVLNKTPVIKIDAREIAEKICGCYHYSELNQISTIIDEFIRGNIPDMKNQWIKIVK